MIKTETTEDTENNRDKKTGKGIDIGKRRNTKKLGEMVKIRNTYEFTIIRERNKCFIGS